MLSGDADQFLMSTPTKETKQQGSNKVQAAIPNPVISRQQGGNQPVAATTTGGSKSTTSKQPASSQNQNSTAK